MKLDTRRRVAPWLIIPGVVTSLAEGTISRLWAFDHVSIAWVIVSFLVFLSLVVAGSIIVTKFWWGHSKFTTPIVDESHVLENRADQLSDRSVAGYLRYPEHLGALLD